MGRWVRRAGGVTAAMTRRLVDTSFLMKLAHIAWLVLLATPAMAQDVMVLANNTGSQMGKAIYCGFPTDEFARAAGRAIDALSRGDRRAEAVKQFTLEATLAAQTGPIGESCDDFRRGYDGSLRILRGAGF